MPRITKTRARKMLAADKQYKLGRGLRSHLRRKAGIGPARRRRRR